MDREEPLGGPPPEGSPAKPAQEEGQPRPRQERREERRLSERRRMSKHGASLRRVYPAAVRKRAAAGRQKRRKL
jgi:hypothetical protein